MHRSDLYSWSVFDAERNLDFHSLLWVRREGNVAVDPLPQSEHDRAHTASLGGVAHVVVTNSDHLRETRSIAEHFGAEVCAPRAEREAFAIHVDRWLGDGDVVVPGLEALEMHGSKTPGELALLLDGATLITGDLIRAHEGGSLCLLPAAKLADRAKADASVRRIAALSGVETVLPGDGWPIFRSGGKALRELADRLPPSKDVASNSATSL